MGFFDLFRVHEPPLIRQCLDDMSAMLETAYSMFIAASAYLLDNETPPFDLEAKDRLINEKERTIRQAVLEHVAIDPTRETVFSLVLVSIVQDAERIGDLAKSLVEIAGVARKPRMGGNVQVLRGVRDQTVQMFENTRAAFVEGEIDLARQVLEDNRAIKARITSFIMDLAGQVDIGANEALVLGIAARMIGRTSSHLSNIASAVALPFDQIRRNDESV